MFTWLKKVREDGLSLRLTFIVMLIISLGVTAALLLSTQRTFLSYDALSNAADTYIELQEAAATLLEASDYLTDQAQCYVVLGEKDHLDNYFNEAEITKRREHALEAMEERLPKSPALSALEEAMNSSLTLMETEYHAMMLVLSAQNDDAIPAALSGEELSKDEAALSPEEKMYRAQHLVHDEKYTIQKNKIRASLRKCIEALKTATHGTQNEMSKRVYRNLVLMAFLIVIQSLGLISMLILTTRLGINPLLRAVDHIKKNQSLPIMGAHEFRYLAGTYNKMYEAYQKSIDNLSYKASHDELTQVYNRAGYDLIKRSIDTSTTALLLFDADKFKEINDNNGHDIGDKILIKLADTLKQNFRPDDYIFRIGGDEFVVFMVHVNKDVKHLIKKKVSQINEELSDTADGLPKISVSVGVSLEPRLKDPQEMFREADAALYHVKGNGRHGCSFFEKGMKPIS